MRAVNVLRYGSGAASVAALGYGGWGLLFSDTAPSRPFAVAQWLAGGLIAHDAVLAPAVFLAGAAAYRLTGPRVRAALAAILLAGGSAALLAVPGILRAGHNANPTVLPFDYARNLLLVLAFVTAAALLPAGLARLLRRDRPPGAEPRPEILRTGEAPPGPGPAEPGDT